MSTNNSVTELSKHVYWGFRTWVLNLLCEFTENTIYCSEGNSSILNVPAIKGKREHLIKKRIYTVDKISNGKILVCSHFKLITVIRVMKDHPIL